MAWTAPMTAAENAIFTSTQFNTYVRDNMLLQAPALVSAAGQYVVGTGVNALAARTSGSASVVTSETTTSTSFVNLTTTGPAATVTTGAQALVMWSCLLSNNTTNNLAIASVAVSGATTVAASDSWSAGLNGVTAANTNGLAGWHYFTGLVAGSNTFTVQYRVNGGTGTFSARLISVLPL